MENKENNADSLQNDLNKSKHESQDLEKKTKSKSNIMRELAPYASLGLQLVITIIIGAYIGWWLDGKYDTSPWFLIALTFFGAFAGMVSFIKTVTKRNKKSKLENFS